MALRVSYSCSLLCPHPLSPLTLPLALAALATLSTLDTLATLATLALAAFALRV